MSRNKIIQASCFVALMAMSITGFAHNKVVVVPLQGSNLTETLYGRAPSRDDETLLFEWPGTGIEVRTRDVGAGDAVYDVRIINTNAAGGSSFYVVEVGSTASTVAPGASIKRGGLIGVRLLLIENKGSLGRMMRLDCFANVIVAGDDGFIQCMGSTAGNP